MSATATDEQALAEKYAPVTRLVQQAEDCGPGEPFVPTDVDTLLGNDTVALRGPWDTDDLVTIAPGAADLGTGLTGFHLDFPGSPLNPGCSYEEWANEQTADSTPTTYARVVTEEGREGLAVQYWLYYPFNDFNNKHESDWEMIQVEFAASDAATALTQDPTRVGYSQHEGVEIADWGDVKLEVVDGTHPVVHPAAGSHANYYDAALFLGRSGQQGFGCDDSRAPTTDVRPGVRLVPSDAIAAGEEYPWLNYTGRWGCNDIFFVNCDGEKAYATSMRALLNRNVTKLLTAQNLITPRADAESLCGRPWNMPKGNDRCVREFLPDHLGQKRKMVILHQDHWVIGFRFLYSRSVSQNWRSIAVIEVLAVERNRHLLAGVVGRDMLGLSADVLASDAQLDAALL